jgi:hypothetical protein
LYSFSHIIWRPLLGKLLHHEKLREGRPAALALVIQNYVHCVRIFLEDIRYGGHGMAGAEAGLYLVVRCKCDNLIALQGGCKVIALSTTLHRKPARILF